MNDDRVEQMHDETAKLLTEIRDAIRMMTCDHVWSVSTFTHHGLPQPIELFKCSACGKIKRSLL